MLLEVLEHTQPCERLTPDILARKFAAPVFGPEPVGLLGYVALQLMRLPSSSLPRTLDNLYAPIAHAVNAVPAVLWHESLPGTPDARLLTATLMLVDMLVSPLLNATSIAALMRLPALAAACADPPPHLLDDATLALMRKVTGPAAAVFKKSTVHGAWSRMLFQVCHAPHVQPSTLLTLLEQVPPARLAACMNASMEYPDAIASWRSHLLHAVHTLASTSSAPALAAALLRALNNEQAGPQACAVLDSAAHAAVDVGLDFPSAAEHWRPDLGRTASLYAHWLAKSLRAACASAAPLPAMCRQGM